MEILVKIDSGHKPKSTNILPKTLSFPVFMLLAQGPQAALALGQALKNKIRQIPEAGHFLSGNFCIQKFLQKST